MVNKRAVISLPRTGKPHPVLLVDVSLGGACIQADVVLAVGDEIQLRVDLGADARFTALALVVGARANRQTLYGQYGLRLLRVEGEGLATLKRYVNGAKKVG